MYYVIKKTVEYISWMKDQTAKTEQIVDKRIGNIKEHGHFGAAKDLRDGLAELKFLSGLRIYFTIQHETEKTVILLLGGNKNGQDKDIKKARKLVRSE